LPLFLFTVRSWPCGPAAALLEVRATAGEPTLTDQPVAVQRTDGPPAPCPFCRQRRPKMTKEDALPRWACRVLDERRATNVRHKSGRGLDRELLRAYPLRSFGSARVEVCGRCNGGWMSALENDVQLFAKPMIRGQATELDATQQGLLAYWALKTALCLSLSLSPDLVPRGEFRDVYDRRSRRRPPDGTQVVLAAYLPAAGRWGSHGKFGRLPGKDGRAASWVATVDIGHLLLQVVRDTEGVLGASAKTRSASTARIWPSVGTPVPWPPPRAMDADAVAELCVTPLRQVLAYL
jgi:hypothetical protein